MSAGVPGDQHTAVFSLFFLAVIIIIIFIIYHPPNPHSPPPMAAGVSATAIALGRDHTCAIEADGGVKCWGWNYNGQLGIGNTDYQTSPVVVPGARGCWCEETR